ncbi:Shikimate 5-dehydrogenase I alpha [hydrothermal vent metagenome]|uniref:shikimate dehydrogenase (NADP(+)) n=1 Tax=hydrothermal vent metagenome TaxID=652676 RepID=A0A3B0ZVL7_9ZZZZ
MSDLFDFDSKKDIYGVMGNPISHSKSPIIHTAFAAQTQQRLEYSAIHVDNGGLQQAVGNFQAAGGKGLNITVPFKQETFEIIDQCSERAKRAGAVNTLTFENDNIIGDNTDGIGLVHDLKNNLTIKIQNKNILLMGAGGATRGVIVPLLNENPRSLFIVNRTVDKAKNLAELFSDYGNISAGSYNALTGKQFDIIINATAASLQGELAPLPDNILTKNAICYDMMYSNQTTPFMDWATQHNAALVSDGLGMLVEQAAESFFIWRAVRPESQALIKRLRQSL